MGLSWHRRGFVAGLVACAWLPACSGGAETANTGGSSPVVPKTATLRFEDPTTLTLTPGMSETVGVLGEPAAGYQIAFALLGEPLDAWLDHAAFAADADTGRAIVELHAPSQATTFHLRASLLDEGGTPGVSADRAVAVSEHGFGSIEVTPVYSGLRAVSEWTANVVARKSCKDLAPSLPSDPPGALSVTAPPNSTLLVENAPVGPSLAVVVRAGHFAWGCADTSLLAPGGTVKLDITILDKPLDLSNAALAATFRYDADAAALAPIFEEGAALLAEAFIPTGTKVESVVLNGMAALVPASSAAAFVAQRITKSWDALAAKHFAAQSPGLRQRLDLWLAAGLVQQSASFEGEITSGADPASAMLTLTRIGTIDATLAGVGAAEPLTWSAQPGDDVLMSTSLAWQPSRFAAAAALGPAQIDIASAASMAEALAGAADCDGLAAAMGAFGTCDVGCVAQLCGAALSARLGVAVGASQAAGLLPEMNIKASPHATTGDAAELSALDGHFLGETTASMLTVSVTGDLIAKAK